MYAQQLSVVDTDGVSKPTLKARHARSHRLPLLRRYLETPKSNWSAWFGFLHKIRMRYWPSHNLAEALGNVEDDS
jgi:hypothetical protein